ncbi:MAG: glutathione S-transferase family protein [Pseudomonadota bacterium]
MKLHWHPFSIIPWRVRIALHEKNLSYDDVIVDVFSNQPDAAFRDINPFAQIPVLEDGGLILAESLAILEYLEEKYPSPALMPGTIEKRATARKLMCWGTDYWPPAWKKWMAPRLPKSDADPWTDESVDEGRKEIAAHLDILEPLLANADWLVGEYSLADICYAPFVLVLDRVELGEEIENRRGVAGWVSRLLERRAIQETMMPLTG